MVPLITAAQQAPWKFHPVGQVGREGGSTRWMEAVQPLATSQPIRLPLQVADGQSAAQVWLDVSDLGDGNADDWVVLEQPRLEFSADASSPVSPIPLRDLRFLTERIRQLIQRESPRSAAYLSALARAEREGCRCTGRAAATGPWHRELEPVCGGRQSSRSSRSLATSLASTLLQLCDA